jgi:hypothetical protein
MKRSESVEHDRGLAVLRSIYGDCFGSVPHGRGLPPGRQAERACLPEPARDLPELR